MNGHTRYTTAAADALTVALAAHTAPQWHHLALCAQTDPDAFFPEPGESAEPAKRVCRGCDVRPACLTYALEHNESHGVWGGLSAPERRRLVARPVPLPIPLPRKADPGEVAA